MWITDKEVAQQELKTILDRVQREAAGLDGVDKEIEQARTPVRVVVAGYAKYLRRDRNKRGRKFVRQAIAYMKWMIDQGAMERLSDFTTQRVDTAALSILDNRGRSPRTVNCYRSHAYSLGEQARRRAKIVTVNPVADVETRTSKSATARKNRRAMTIDEAYALLAVAGDRWVPYATMLWMGLRVSEAAALEWRDLHLDGDRPAISLRAETTKARRADEIPLHAGVATELLRVKPDDAGPNDRVFSSIPTLRTFQRDLDRAGIGYSTGDNSKPCGRRTDRTLDRHAMRTSYISWLGEHGVDPRAQIALARHSPKGVTLKNYQDFTFLDLRGEYGKLPSPRAAQTKPSQAIA